MANTSRKQRSAGNVGCGYMLYIAFVICALLVINGMLVKAFVSFNMPDIDSRIEQAMLFVVPVVMIFAEFWFFDTISRNSEK